ncbi:MAG: hypothetical protein K2X03_22710 [Bryobacteraceae bacterium]|nr:hypothetical protein [Bryobacteraceae bacterium]
MKLTLLLWLALPLPAATFYVTVSGLGGEPEYETRFAGLATEAHKLVTGTPDAKAFLHSGILATKAKIRESFTQIATDAGPDDNLVVLLIGHGTFDGTDYKINLPGPDLSGVELAALLDRVKAKKQLVVNTTSASGASVASLQRPNRVVIAATKSGTERNATVFARFWVEALRDAGADADKNETVMALEAFRYADQKTVQYYERGKRIATEHAVLEDTGQGEAVRNPAPDNGHGLVASRTPLLRLGAAQKSAADPAKQQLLSKRDDVEQRIDQLKYNKAAMPAAEYRKQLQVLLVELAKVQKEIDQ